MTGEDEVRDIAREILRNILNEVVTEIIRLGVKQVAWQIKLNSRTEPFWAKKWRGRR